ncbi:plasmid pRiA4b ORF-3 family protein [Pseudomonas sp.]|uniref:plasmid pRiA4b ORF-3 family protein n=1 Tax=Pseudomonas sp. TaxID=306 RepID=UPI002585CFC5|nr:plasmid pRiA4b ORF-3 family protein [Pseudomonas sp.]
MPTPLLSLHVELSGIEPAIWRHLVVPADLTLPQLHEALQVAMGWHDMHLHEFRLQGRDYGVPDPGGAYGAPLTDEAGVVLAEALGGATVFSYLYDLGDDWLHEITVSPYHGVPRVSSAPFCVEGANACPPEDSGGPIAYADFVEAITDPAHPDHPAMVDWHGQDFDPQAWAITTTNRHLKKLQQAWKHQKLNRG